MYVFIEKLMDNTEWPRTFSAFMNHTHEISSMISLMYTEPIFMICSVAALKKLLSHEAELEKPARQTTAVTYVRSPSAICTSTLLISELSLLDRIIAYGARMSLPQTETFGSVTEESSVRHSLPKREFLSLNDRSFYDHLLHSAEREDSIL